MKHNDQLPDGLLAQMIEHCTGIHRGHGFKSCTGLVFTTAQVVFITQKITFIFMFVDRVVLQILMQSLYLGLKTDDLPVIRQRGPYKSEEEYLNTYFRLLREECFYKLRKGIHDFVTNGFKCSSKDMTMYRYKQIAVLLSHGVDI